MDAQQVYCPTCGVPCPAANINISALVAKCGSCDSIFRLPIDEQTSGPEEILPPSRPRSIQVIDTLDGLKLQWRWWSWMAIPMLFFCMFWDGFLVVWYSIAFTQMNPDSAEFWLMTLFPIGHLAAGVGLTYMTLTTMFNRTTIHIDRGILSIRNGPLPWRSPPDLETTDIRGFEIELSTWSTRTGPRGGWGLHYQLAAQDQSGEQRILLKMLPADQARYLSYELATFLNVPCRENNAVPLAGFSGILERFRNTASNRGR